MNEFVLDFHSDIDPSILVTSTTRLLDTGAEFAKFSTEHDPMSGLTLFRMMSYASSADFVDGKLKLA